MAKIPVGGLLEQRPRTERNEKADRPIVKENQTAGKQEGWMDRFRWTTLHLQLPVIIQLKHFRLFLYQETTKLLNVNLCLQKTDLNLNLFIVFCHSSSQCHGKELTKVLQLYITVIAIFFLLLLLVYKNRQFDQKYWQKNENYISSELHCSKVSQKIKITKQFNIF